MGHVIAVSGKGGVGKTTLVNDKEQDKEILENIQKACDDLNTQISGLSGIKAFEERIAPEYKKYRHEDCQIRNCSEGLIL